MTRNRSRVGGAWRALVLQLVLAVALVAEPLGVVEATVGHSFNPGHERFGGSVIEEVIRHNRLSQHHAMNLRRQFEAGRLAVWINDTGGQNFLPQEGGGTRVPTQGEGPGETRGRVMAFDHHGDAATFTRENGFKNAGGIMHAHEAAIAERLGEWRSAGVERVLVVTHDAADADAHSSQRYAKELIRAAGEPGGLEAARQAGRIGPGSFLESMVLEHAYYADQGKIGGPRSGFGYTLEGVFEMLNAQHEDLRPQQRLVLGQEALEVLRLAALELGMKQVPHFENGSGQDPIREVIERAADLERPLRYPEGFQGERMTARGRHAAQLGIQRAVEMGQRYQAAVTRAMVESERSGRPVSGGYLLEGTSGQIESLQVHERTFGEGERAERRPVVSAQMTEGLPIPKGLIYSSYNVMETSTGEGSFRPGKNAGVVAVRSLNNHGGPTFFMSANGQYEQNLEGVSDRLLKTRGLFQVGPFDTSAYFRFIEMGILDQRYVESVGWHRLVEGTVADARGLAAPATQARVETRGPAEAGRGLLGFEERVGEPTRPGALGEAEGRDWKSRAEEYRKGARRGRL